VRHCVLLHTPLTGKSSLMIMADHGTGSYLH
jgi:hypothetical protein